LTNSEVDEMDEFDKIIDRLLHPLDYMPKVEREPIELPEQVCDICGGSEQLLSEGASMLMTRIIKQLTSLRNNETPVICLGCLQRFVKIRLIAMIYNPLKKRYEAVARKTIPFSVKKLQHYLRLKSQKPAALQIKLVPNGREIRREFRRRRYRLIRTLAIGSDIDRLYEGYGRPKRPKLPKAIIKRPTVKDVFDVLTGKAKLRPEVTIGCGDCDKAVCPADCPKRALADQLIIFKKKKRVVVDEYQLSDYEDFP